MNIGGEGVMDLGEAREGEYVGHRESDGEININIAEYSRILIEGLDKCNIIFMITRKPFCNLFWKIGLLFIALIATINNTHSYKHLLIVYSIHVVCHFILATALDSRRECGFLC